MTDQTLTVTDAAQATPTCPLCGRELPNTALRPRDRWFGLGEAFELRQCDHCDLAITFPQPQGEDLGRYYPEQYDAWQRPPIRSSPRPAA